MTDDNNQPKRGNPNKARGNTFIPYTPGVKLTDEQLDKLFPPKRREAFIRELARLVWEASAENDDEKTIPPMSG